MCSSRRSKATPKPAPTAKACVIDGCERPQKNRGLCSRCYQSAWKLVNSQELSWGELERRGLALPSRRGRRPSNAFAKALEKSR